MDSKEDFEVDIDTGVYDVSFFAREERTNSSQQHLKDARVGLGLFLDEANIALQHVELTVDQRLHIATITSFIQGLADRFDRISVPGFRSTIKDNSPR